MYLVETEGDGENHVDTEGEELQAPVPGCFSSEECRSKFGQFFGTGPNDSQQFSSIWILDFNNIVHL